MATSSENIKREARDEVESDADGINFISIKIKNQDDEKLLFNVKPDTKLVKVFKRFCNKKNMEYESTQFIYEGTYVNGKRQSAKELNMGNGAEILATRMQVGGGVGALNFY